MKMKGNPRFKKVTKRIPGNKHHKGYTKTVYKLKKRKK